MRLLGWFALVASCGLIPGGACSCQKNTGEHGPDAADPDAFVAITPDAPVAPPDADLRAPVKDGLGSPDQLIFEDDGLADPAAGVRALMAFPIRDEAGLDAALATIYDPAAAGFRAYLTADAWRTAYAPPQVDVDTIGHWLETRGFTVPRIASNRLLLEFDGTVAQFNAAFGVQLHVLHKIVGGDAYQYGTVEALTMPIEKAPLIAAVLTADLPADDSPLPGESGTVTSTPPPNIADAFTPARLARAYQLDALHAAGFHGEGMTIGVVMGATFKFKDLRSFWLGFGITRADPEVQVVMPPISTRYFESTIDTEWAGAMAPAARLIVYQAPDVRDTSLSYAFNEAIARAEANVITDSFAHRESSEPPEIRWQYQRSAKMAAALGISVVASAGDSSGPVVPASSAWVTAIGGSIANDDGAGNVSSETVWDLTGLGESLTVPAPAWQDSIVTPHGRRGANDLALSSGRTLWAYWLGTWNGTNMGTSFAAPSFAGMLAVIDGARAARGLAPVGCINPALYRSTAVQQSFRDITSGTAAGESARPGWDMPSGWGAPRADLLDQALP